MPISRSSDRGFSARDLARILSRANPEAVLDALDELDITTVPEDAPAAIQATDSRLARSLDVLAAIAAAATQVRSALDQLRGRLGSIAAPRDARDAAILREAWQTIIPNLMRLIAVDIRSEIELQIASTGAARAGLQRALPVPIPHDAGPRTARRTPSEEEADLRTLQLPFPAPAGGRPSQLREPSGTPKARGS